MWAIPTQTGDTQYVTAINWGYVEGQNASKVVKGQTAKLNWNGTAPRFIYDVPGISGKGAAGQLLTAAQAGTVDLTQDGFHLYAVLPRPVTVPRIEISATEATLKSRADGFYYATVSVGTPALRGVPVQVAVREGGNEATLYGASGTPIKLPLTSSDAGTYSLAATELLSGQSAPGQVTIAPSIPTRPLPPATDNLYPALARFAHRKGVPVAIVLTPEQSQDATLRNHAERLRKYYLSQGRSVGTTYVEPRQVVTSLQALQPIQPYPQWQTCKTDLVLLGNPQNNPLLFDQARGYLLPGKIDSPNIQITDSPFAGECQVINVLANDNAGLAAGVEQIVLAGQPPRLRAINQAGH